MSELLGLLLIVALTTAAGLALQCVVRPAGDYSVSEPQKTPVLGGRSPQVHAWQRYHIRYYPMTFVGASISC